MPFPAMLSLLVTITMLNDCLIREHFKIHEVVGYDHPLIHHHICTRRPDVGYAPQVLSRTIQKTFITLGYHGHVNYNTTLKRLSKGAVEHNPDLKPELIRAALTTDFL